MTISYTNQVTDGSRYGVFLKMLFTRWRGSVFKLILKDLFIYCFFYACMSLVYRFTLNDYHKKEFDITALYFEKLLDHIPLQFILGFYVSLVVGRWWNQFMSLPDPYTMATFTSTTLTGHDTFGRLMRRTIMRYANLAIVLTYRMVSPPVMMRFPTLTHLVDAGLMNPNEKEIYENLSKKTDYTAYWMPLIWAGALVGKARKEGRLRDDFATKTLIDEIARIRSNCGTIIGYGMISIPLVYTQVVTIAVYTFFSITIVSRQFLDSKTGICIEIDGCKKEYLDTWVPFFTLLQFIMYMGWMKVAESLVNPFGLDDDDFEINWLIDFNLQFSYLVVDEMHNEHPELLQDMYWNEVVPHELPYTKACQSIKKPIKYINSTADIEVKEEDQGPLPKDVEVEQQQPADHII